MCQQSKKNQSSDRFAYIDTSSRGSIGDLFRDHGEKYIETYRPSQQEIKLIRSIRVCRTPAMGGIKISCTECKATKYIYRSCGNSQCMLCQSIKREQWIDKLKNKLLQVPYCHIVFTLPHELNGIAKRNPEIIYRMMLQQSWNTIHKVTKSKNNLGAMPGMISVLHTFGSACNYHVHIHALVTFGGINKSGKWEYPKNKKRIAPYREMCRTFRDLCITELHKENARGNLEYHIVPEKIIEEVKNKRWVVHSTRPTMDTNIIENYLARYINRIAISPSRIAYAKDTQKAHILYNDYKNQKPNEAAPKSISVLEPLVAIDQIIQHVLPPRFQKTRTYGIHHGSNKLKIIIPQECKRHPRSIRTVMEIITQLLGLKKYQCENCGSEEYEKTTIVSDRSYIYTFLNISSGRSPPKPTNTGYQKTENKDGLAQSTGIPMAMILKTTTIINPKKQTADKK